MNHQEHPTPELPDPALLHSSSEPVDHPSHQPDPRWTADFMLSLCAIAQLATVLISWPAWQVRSVLTESMPNLPWIPGTPQFPMGLILSASLGLVLLRPRSWGVCIHFVALGLAMAMDQIRFQPQLFSVAFLMAACVWPWARRLCLWYLIAMWSWAGIHKLLSPDWFGYVSGYMFQDVQRRLHSLGIETDFLPQHFHRVFAGLVAAAEVATGVLAWLRPKTGALACLLLHLGIACFLILLDWNFSVLPWNLCTAIVGAWLICNRDGVSRSRLPFPRRRLERIVVVGMLLLPIGFYFGLVRHGAAHVLYSNNLPLCLINRSDRFEQVDCWQDLRLPFPHAEKSFVDYFRRTGEANETLHIQNQLPWLQRNRYFRHHGDQKVQEISESEFLSDRDDRFHISQVEDPRKIFQLEIAGARLEHGGLGVTASIQFSPDCFEALQLELLSGLPNLERIGLANCQLNDSDLKRIPPLGKLTAIDLSGTAVTDEAQQTFFENRQDD